MENDLCLGLIFDSFVINNNNNNIRVCSLSDIKYGVKKAKDTFIPVSGTDANEPIFNKENDKIVFIIDDFNGLFSIYNTYNVEVIKDLLKKDYAGYFSYNEKEDKLYKIRDLDIIETCNKLFDKKESKNMNIKGIYDELTASIINQDDQIRNIVTALYKNINLAKSNLPDYLISKQKQNILITGPTGTGKTEIIRELSHLLDIPMVVEDSSRYTEAGYVGGDIDDMFRHLLKAADNDLGKAEEGILVLDEFDKLASVEKGNVSKDGVQESILTMLEGTKRHVDKSNSSNMPSFIFDTTKLTIIGIGAFAGIEKIRDKRLKFSKGTPIGFGAQIMKKEEINEKFEIEDFVEFGLMPEVMGRFPQIIQMSELKPNDMIDILNKSKHSPLILQRKFLESLGVKLNIDDKYIEAVAKRAEELKCGARSLNTIIDYSINGALFEIFNGNYKELTLDENSIKDNKQYTLK